GRRGREGDAPEVGRAGTDPLLHDLQRPGCLALAAHPGELRDRPISVPIGLERLQCELGGLGAAAPPWPVEAEGHRPLVFRSVFDNRANGHGLSMATRVVRPGSSLIWESASKICAQ